MATFDLAVFAPTRPTTSGMAERLRKEWIELMDQMFAQAKMIPGDKKPEGKKRQWLSRWNSLKSRIVATKDVGKSHELDMEFTFPKNIYAAVADAEQKVDRWKLGPATVARSKSGLPKSKAVVKDDPPTPTPAPRPSTSRSSAKPVVEIRMKNPEGSLRKLPNGNDDDGDDDDDDDDDTQENDPPCELCKGRTKCIGKRPGGACNRCAALKKGCSLSSWSKRGSAAKAPGGLLTFFSASAKESQSEVVQATVDLTRVAKRKRITLEEEEEEEEEKSKQGDEALKRRIREIETELLQLSDNAHALSNKAYTLAIEIREVGRSLGPEDRK